LRTGPDVGQSFYWLAGAFTYCFPVILTTIYLGLIAKYLKATSATSKRKLLLIAGILMFCAAATSETNGAVQCAGLLLATLICRWKGRRYEDMRRSLPMLHAGLASSVISSIIVGLAPGNAARETTVRKILPPLPLDSVVSKSFSATARFVADFLRYRPSAAFAVILVAIILGWYQTVRRPRIRAAALVRAWLLGCTLTLLMVFSCFLPGVYALGTLPPERAQFMAQWVVLVFLLLSGFLCGVLAAHRYQPASQLSVLIAGVLLLAPVLPWTVKASRNVFASFDDLRSYASEWDGQDRQIRRLKASGRMDIALPWNAQVAKGGNVGGVEWMSSDPTNWVNTCAANYYGVRSIRIISPEEKVSNARVPEGLSGSQVPRSTGKNPE
jgi:hypothetical protein